MIKNDWLRPALAWLLLLGSCGNAGTPADKVVKNDSTVKQDSIRKAAYKNHDLSIIFLEASSRLLQCQLLLEKADAGGQKYGMADSLLVNSKKGDTLYQAMKKVYEVGIVYAPNETDKNRYAEMKMPDNSQLWLQKHFKGSQSVEALNTLNRLQHDCNTIHGMVPQ
jgi:hypothetical protein